MLENNKENIIEEEVIIEEEKNIFETIKSTIMNIF